MLERVAFTNFKSLKNTVFYPTQFCLIAGPNASGKTSILDGIHYASQLLSSTPSSIFRGHRSLGQLRTRGASGPMAMTLESGQTKDNIAHFSFEAQDDYDSEDDLYIKAIGFTGPSSAEASSTGKSELFPVSPKLRNTLRRHFGSIVHLRLSPRKLATATYSTDAVPRVEYDGLGLAAVLADLSATSPDSFTALKTKAAQVIPQIENIRFERAIVSPDDEWDVPANKENAWGYRLLLDYKGAPSVRASNASEGSLFVLGLLAIIYSKARPRIILIDELERGIHPQALGHLVSAMRAVIRDTHTQLIATTHSPYLMDAFDASDVFLTSIDDSNTTSISRLSDHPQFEEWKGKLHSGEFWSSVGEAWMRLPFRKDY